MTKAKHTPGPWEVKQFGGPQISGPAGYAVRTMWGALHVDDLQGQDAANARLIAAAPDLLEALEELIGDTEWGCYRATYLKARAAIAKARGE